MTKHHFAKPPSVGASEVWGQPGVGPAIFLNFQIFGLEHVGNRFWPFSAFFRPPTGPGRNQDVAMARGLAPAPKEAEKGPTPAKHGFQTCLEKIEIPDNSWPCDDLRPLDS